MTPLRRRLLLVLMLVAGVLGQQDSTSTVSPQSIFDLNEEDFKLWLSGREPKAWQGGGSASGATTTPATTTAESVFRTTSTTERPSTTTSSTTSSRTTDATLPPPTFPSFQPADGGKSWLEEEAPTTPSSDVLGQQFRPAGEDFAQWLERQMNKVQEVSFVPQTTLGGDQVQGLTGLVTRVTTIRNRIPSSSPFGPSTVPTFAPVTPSTVAPFAPQPPIVGPSTAILGQPDGRPEDLQQWLRDQLQTSQQLTDRLLSQWTPSGTVIRGHAGDGYQPSAVSYQTSALIHGVGGVAHAAQHRFDQHQQQLPFPGTSHSTDGYLSHQKPITTSHQQQQQQQQQLAVNYLPHGGYYYSRPVAGPLFGPYVTSHGAPFLINYH
ncbi:mucin-5B-like [Anopheles aquasalis]|uniref:mucin-5B-like n=1 Tax=Anopheles aquasalis TaxID=42839 RepID=UPI00215A4EBF|nr:mucin-5B-like [Anopheles aquasalis]XP_050092090.1 mucin-5B-like [Anopheles aquasalis]XP_050092091.1 mucin-5B-like [Anopheles aquasalis]